MFNPVRRRWARQVEVYDEFEHPIFTFRTTYPEQCDGCKKRIDTGDVAVTKQVAFSPGRVPRSAWHLDCFGR